MIQHGHIKGRIGDIKGRLADNKGRLAAGLGHWILGPELRAAGPAAVWMGEAGWMLIVWGEMYAMDSSSF